MPTEIYRNGFGWVSKEVSKELLAHIFPNYPEIRVCHPLPDWIKERLKEAASSRMIQSD
jgi:hypothetical protein